eukprot:TRINITY_DN44958_c0_g1_i1.p1 TRINITY_DN44958_c0_g1~~TRINITY_DN44958_c0_g1_i1.p1  ORF type:complete len:320 (-),score=48.93 TRINITY_DN44958_c0_g1_i1:27-986(-)
MRALATGAERCINNALVLLVVALSAEVADCHGAVLKASHAELHLHVASGGQLLGVAAGGNRTSQQRQAESLVRRERLAGHAAATGNLQKREGERFPPVPVEVAKAAAGAADGLAESVPPMSFHRKTRIVFTITLCVLGLSVFFLHGGWLAALAGRDSKRADDAAARSRGWEKVPPVWRRYVVLADLFGRLLLIHPLIEHLLHRALHVCGVHGHTHHHQEVAQGLHEYATFEAWPYLLGVLAYPCELTRPATLGLLQYAWFHQMSHDWPALALPGTSELHMLHHKDSHVNFVISSTMQHWPDVILGCFASARNSSTSATG